MPLYNVYGKVSGTKYLGEIEAESEEKAVGIALESDMAGISLCNQCAIECEDAVIDAAVAELVEPQT